MLQNEEVVKEWIEKAEEDFGFASTSIERTDYLMMFALGHEN